METSEIINIVMFIIAIISIIFAVWFKVRDPQEKTERNQALDFLATEKDKVIAEKDLGTKATVLAQKEMETKALILAEQVKNKDVENERRFNEMGVRLDTAFALAQNHIHTVDTKVDELIKTVGIMSNEITKLGTIIEERIPRKPC